MSWSPAPFSSLSIDPELVPFDDILHKVAASTALKNCLQGFTSPNYEAQLCHLLARRARQVFLSLSVSICKTRRS